MICQKVTIEEGHFNLRDNAKTHSFATVPQIKQQINHQGDLSFQMKIVYFLQKSIVNCSLPQKKVIL